MSPSHSRNKVSIKLSQGELRPEPKVAPRIPTERERSIRPGRPHTTSHTSLRRPGFPSVSRPLQAFSRTTSRLLRLARAISRPASRAFRKGSRQISRTLRSWHNMVQQRSTVTVRYAKPRGKGSWRAHGRYLERDSAAGPEGLRPEDRVGLAKEHNIGDLTGGWQSQSDERLWKIIVSPEHGEDVDFGAIANELISHLREETGSELQWAGVVHRNTEHPHLHLLIRGRRDDGAPLTFTRKQIRFGMRQAVRREITAQLGYRSPGEIAMGRVRETASQRVTSLDRELASHIELQKDGGHADAAEWATIHPTNWLERKRLLTLKGLNLARFDNGAWSLQKDFLKQLKEIQTVRERGRALFRNGVALSDDKMPIEMAQRSRRLVGRVLLNSEEELSGGMQTAFETLDGKITFIPHDATLRGAWLRGDLQPGNIIVIDQVKSEPDRLYAASLGKDKELLRNPYLLEKTAERLRRQGLLPEAVATEKGWLGEFAKAIQKIQRSRERGL
jgi:hypothetical protein